METGAGRLDRLADRRQRQAELQQRRPVGSRRGRTRLSWLGTGPVAATPAAVKGELEKLAYLRGLDADTLDLLG